MFPPLHTDTHSHPPAALTGSPRGPRSPGEPGAPLSPLLPCKEVVGTQVQDTLLVLQTPPSSPAPALLLLGRSQPLSVLTLSPGGPSGPGEPSSPISPVGPGSPLLPGAPCKSKQDQKNQWVLEQSPMCQRGQGQAQLWGQKWNGDFTPTFSPGLPGIPCRPGFPSSPGSPCTRTQQDRVNKDTSVPAGGFWFRAEEA